MQINVSTLVTSKFGPWLLLIMLPWFPGNNQV